MAKRPSAITARAFNQDVSRAKRAADKGPVIITNRGEPAYVLMTHKAYRELAGGEKNIVDMLAMPGIGDIEFNPPRLDLQLRIPTFDE